MTLDPGDWRVVVSKRIRDEFSNGKDYYKLEGQQVREPNQSWPRPTAENLEFHAYNIFQ
jgi:putative restriction endonuclease